MPLTSHGVFSEHWAAHHRPTAVSSMRARCEVIDRSTPPPSSLDDPDPGETIAATGVPCRVQQLNAGAGTGAVAGQLLTTRDYLITLPMDTPVTWRAGEGGHRIRVTDPGPDGDPTLTGRRLDVTQVLTGSEIWERDLLCVDDLTQNRGEDGA